MQRVRMNRVHIELSICMVSPYHCCDHKGSTTLVQLAEGGTLLPSPALTIAAVHLLPLNGVTRLTTAVSKSRLRRGSAEG